ncbi:MarR family winged helix-turn-helix transcriptional regulator [Streptomyces sp. NPDC096311]|uniref:MarR family winged helix-turn-helix transcriptional regulator n=1 Tax=Streptomyces sp. NPDC096311 TaxID=3366083 RepID=UPI00380F58B1
MPPTSESIQRRADAAPTAVDTPMGEALFRAARMHRMVASNLLRETGLYPGQELLMMQLWQRGAQRQADLIKTLGLDPSTVTKMLQRLEQSGFVTRRPSDEDRRAVVVDATRAGQALRDRVLQVWRELETITADGFTSEEYDQAMGILARIEANLMDTSSTDGEDSPGIPPRLY